MNDHNLFLFKKNLHFALLPFWQKFDKLSRGQHENVSLNSFEIGPEVCGTSSEDVCLMILYLGDFPRPDLGLNIGPYPIQK